MCTIQCNAIQYADICNTIHNHAMQFNQIKCNSNTIQYNTIHYILLLFCNAFMYTMQCNEMQSDYNALQYYVKQNVL